MTEKEEEKKLETDEKKVATKAVEDILALNKLGALCIRADNFEKAEKILTKTLKFYLEKIANQTVPYFFYSILFCNIAKAFSCQKKFKEAKPYYIEIIKRHPLSKILIENQNILEKYFNITDYEHIYENKEKRNEKDILIKFESLMKFFDKNSESKKIFEEKILSNFKDTKINTKSSLSDCLVNLAVILQIEDPEIKVSLDMYILSIILDINNHVPNVNFNNYLREVNLKLKSDEYINRRIQYDLNDDSIKIEPENALNNKNNNNENDDNNNKFIFISMKWGEKYGADYVNKLYNGIKKNFTIKPFLFYCITEKKDGLNENIKVIELQTKFSGWMKKSILFDDKILNQIENINNNTLLCFIDLDMIIYNNINFLNDYKGNFALMKTDDIKCEGSHNGYNSSIVLYRKYFGKKIYETMEKFEELLTKQIVRFDHYLEFIVKNSDFLQDVFEGKILDYNTYCKDKKTNELPENGAIIAFPRSPKPHQCNEEWIKLYWSLE